MGVIFPREPDARGFRLNQEAIEVLKGPPGEKGACGEPGPPASKWLWIVVFLWLLGLTASQMNGQVFLPPASSDSGLVLS